MSSPGDPSSAWIGKVPGYWDAVPLKRLFEIRKRIAGRLGFDVLAVTQRGVQLKETESGGGQLSMDYSKYQIVEAGDFVMNHMDLLTGFVDISRFNGVTSPDYRVFMPRPGVDIDRRYYLYIFQLCYHSRLFYPLGQGSAQFGRWRLPRSAFEAFVLPVPPRQEQQAIADLLDRKTAAIDELIAKKERLVELLQEKRQALITQAVTKGLDPNVPMNESGSDWYGQIPRAWQPGRLKNLVWKVADGPHYSPPYVEKGAGYMFISARNVKVDGWSFEDAKYVSEDLFREFCRRVIPERGDVLYTKGGTTGIARAVDFDEPFQVWVHVAVLKLIKKRVIPDYLAYALNSAGCYAQSQLHTRGATNQDLGLTRMVNIELPIPPLTEQREIVAHLDKMAASLDSLVSNLRRSVDLLKEYRQTLITEAVTGKLDISKADQVAA